MNNGDVATGGVTGGLHVPNNQLAQRLLTR
jgi:hypothetical protein